MSIRIGVVGAGYWGANLIRNAAACPAVTLAAICDANESALTPFRAKHPLAVFYTDFMELLRDASIAGVILASPASLHARQTRLALEAGKHVLVEKPLAMSGADACDLVREAAAQQRLLMVGHTFLYNNLVARVREIIVSGELGDIYYLYGQRLNLGQIRHDVDVLWNLAPHDVSIANHLMGALPEQVQAVGLSYIQPHKRISDVCFFALHYPGGRAAHIHISWLDPLKVRRMVVVGSRKMLVYDDMKSDAHIQIFDKSVEKEFRQPFSDFAEFTTKICAGGVRTVPIVLQEPLAAEIEHFAACIAGIRRPCTDGRHGAEVVFALEALTRSMHCGGTPVPVDYSMIPSSWPA